MAEDAYLLETDRLKLRPFESGDTGLLYGLHSDVQVMRYVGNGVQTQEKVLQCFNRCQEHQAQYGFSMWAVFEKTTQAFVGRAGLIHLDQTSDIEVGYVLHRDFWGKGYATELANALVSWGFSALGLDKITAIAVPENTASRHVMEKIGMRYVRDDVFYGTAVAYYELENNLRKKKVIFG